jgi:hypothetical protein
MIQGQGPGNASSDTVTPNSVIRFTDNDITKALQGAWGSTVTDEKGDRITATKIIMDGYMAVAYYNEQTGDFIKTYGGHWTVDQNSMSLTVEFSSADKAMVGKTISSEFEFSEDQKILTSEDIKWNRIDQGKGHGLNGAWLITGRKRDGQLTRSTPGDRKTMKILSGTRFQWIAYNTATGAFFGSGGGTYSASDGTYTENIEFFSRDNKRVGAQLNFHYEIKEKEWHHSGLSSKGDPIYEIWSPRIMPVKN